MAEFKFENRGILKLPLFEKILDDLRRKNNQTRMKKIQDIKTNPFTQYILGLDMVNSLINSIDIEDLENKDKIESYFPNIQKIEANNENKIVHKHTLCVGCGMIPIVGIRYKCKECRNYDLCENCFDKFKENHKHDFEKIEQIMNDEKIPDKILDLLIKTQIKNEYNYLKGLFFYKSTREFYEIDILKLFNELIGNIPYYFNLLLCYDDLEDDQIYAFCVRAINCVTNNLFILVRPEELKIAKEKLIFNILNNLLEKKGIKLNLA